jgi:hypothetical protein
VGAHQSFFYFGGLTSSCGSKKVLQISTQFSNSQGTVLRLFLEKNWCDALRHILVSSTFSFPIHKDRSKAMFEIHRTKILLLPDQDVQNRCLQGRKVAAAWERSSQMVA